MTYEYQCQKCGETFEVEHAINAVAVPQLCPAQGRGSVGNARCGGKLKRLLFPVAGWLK